jgi:iron complex transport system substrate-binding protein
MRVLLIAAGVLLIVALGGLVFLGTGEHHGRVDLPDAVNGATAGPPQRIVSLSPSVTEILFALGLGDRVVGVTRFCQYPPEAREKPQVGGYLDPSYEAILALKPDLVVLRSENEQFVNAFRQLGLNLLPVRHDSVEGVLDSIGAIGRRCGVEAQARRMVADIQSQIHRIAERTAGVERPRVLVVAFRTLGTGKIQNAYVAGADNFMNRMIALAGGKNACADISAGFPVVSGEGIIRMKPQVILDLVAERSEAGMSREEILRDWQQLPDVEAVRAGRVYLIDDDYAFIPGPRFIRLVEKFARLIHPETFASAEGGQGGEAGTKQPQERREPVTQ